MVVGNRFRFFSVGRLEFVQVSRELLVVRVELLPNLLLHRGHLLLHAGLAFLLVDLQALLLYLRVLGLNLLKDLGFHLGGGFPHSFASEVGKSLLAQFLVSAFECLVVDAFVLARENLLVDVLVKLVH